MTELLTAAQMRAIEKAAIDSGEVTGLELMERAGQGVVDAVLEEWPEMALSPHRAVVLCGPGNNGGDGFVVARMLKQRGWKVEVFLYGDEAKLPPDAAENGRRWREMGEVGSWDDLLEEHGWDSETNMCFNANEVLFVDALFGTGLIRSLDSEIVEFLHDATYRNAGKSVAVDLRSGICSDSGRDLQGSEFPMDTWFDLVVTFHRAKPAHLLVPEGQGAGTKTFRIVDIGLNSAHRDFKWRNWIGPSDPEVDQAATRYRPVRWVGKKGERDPALPVPAPKLPKYNHGHKYSHGHALLLSGPAAHTGAIRLAARGALRIGAGLVTIGAHPDAVPEHAAQLNAIMLRQIVNDRVLTETLQDDRINALCLGPAMGLNEETRLMMRAALAAKRPTVLDADALTMLAREDDPFAALHADCVLTPHAGEFARLFPDIAEKLAAPATKGPAYSKVDATRDAAARAGCVVLFKGPDTVIADPSGRAAINSAHYERSAPWLATAGSGDVLAGFITGLLARGFSPMAAAETGAWLHVECALKFGPGLIAEDLPEQLPSVFRDLGL